EVAQQTLAQFAADYKAGHYQRERGRLSSWLLGIARNRVIDRARARRRERLQRGESAIAHLTEEPNAAEAWEHARRRTIFERALDILRSDTRLDRRTILAFELCALRETPVPAAALECGMSVAEIYVA